MNRIVLLLLSSLIISCSYYPPIYWGWSEWAGSDFSGVEHDAIARLNWSKHPGVITSIDENTLGAGYKKAKLLPGMHVVKYGYFTAQFGEHPNGTIEMEFKACHSYQFGLKLCFWCSPRKYAVWIDDKTTGELVWGKRPDWPFWFL
jgi:hypothetical protein